jgi:hypothetical protein
VRVRRGAGPTVDAISGAALAMLEARRLREPSCNRRVVGALPTAGSTGVSGSETDLPKDPRQPGLSVMLWLIDQLAAAKAFCATSRLR